MKRLIFPLMIGLLGTLTLVWLGTWQVQRLMWKQEILGDIESRIAADTVSIPANPDPTDDLFLPVNATGQFVGDPIRVLVSVKIYGAGHRLISAFDTGERKILIDRGYLRLQSNAEIPSGTVEIIGNLHWPKDADSYTPEPEGNLWFARDVSKMAKTLGTDPILIVARELSPPEQNVTPLPVDKSSIPNDHFEYAVTWFSLAVIWLLMTGYWVRRNRAPVSKAE